MRNQSVVYSFAIHFSDPSDYESIMQSLVNYSSDSESERVTKKRKVFIVQVPHEPEEDMKRSTVTETKDDISNTQPQESSSEESEIEDYFNIESSKNVTYDTKSTSNTKDNKNNNDTEETEDVEDVQSYEEYAAKYRRQDNSDNSLLHIPEYKAQIRKTGHAEIKEISQHEILGDTSAYSATRDAILASQIQKEQNEFSTSRYSYGNRRNNNIMYLAFQAKQRQAEFDEATAQRKVNQRETRKKYGF
jgi:hypothetical protein